MKTFVRFLTEKSGATAVEYGILAGLISVALLAGFAGMSNSLLNVLQKVSSHITLS